MDMPKQMDGGQVAPQSSRKQSDSRQQEAQQPTAKQQSDGNRASEQMGTTIITDWASI